MGQQQIQISMDSYLLTIQLVNSRYSTDQKSLYIYAQNVDADIEQQNLQANYGYQQLPQDIKQEFKSIQKLFDYLLNITGANSACCMRDISLRKSIKIQKKQLCFDRKGHEYRLKLNIIQSNNSGSIFDDKLKQNQKNSKISIEQRLESQLKKQKQLQNIKNNNNLSEKNNHLVMTNDQISYKTMTLNHDISKKTTQIDSNNIFKYFICSSSNQKLLNLRQKNPFLKQFLQRRILSNQQSTQNQNNSQNFINEIDTKIVTDLDLFDNQLKNEDFNFIFRSITKNSFDSYTQDSNPSGDWSQLRKIWIDKNKITIIKDNFLNYFSKQLEIFSLSENMIGHAAISKIFCNRFKWPQLKMLKISFLQEQVEQCLKAIVDYLINLGSYCMPSLKKIVITQIPQKIIESQSIISQLQKLKLYGNILHIKIQQSNVRQIQNKTLNNGNSMKMKTMIVQFKKVEVERINLNADLYQDQL